jgi:hypothetical protein
MTRTIPCRSWTRVEATCRLEHSRILPSRSVTTYGAAWFRPDPGVDPLGSWSDPPDPEEAAAAPHAPTLPPESEDATAAPPLTPALPPPEAGPGRPEPVPEDEPPPPPQELEEDPVPMSGSTPAAPPAPPPAVDDPPPELQSSRAAGGPRWRRSKASQTRSRTASCHVDGRSPRVRCSSPLGKGWSKPSSRSQASTTARP